MKIPLVSLQAHWAAAQLINLWDLCILGCMLPPPKIEKSSCTSYLSSPALSYCLEFTAIFICTSLSWPHCCFRQKKMWPIRGQKLLEICCVYFTILKMHLLCFHAHLNLANSPSWWEIVVQVNSLDWKHWLSQKT